MSIPHQLAAGLLLWAVGFAGPTCAQSLGGPRLGPETEVVWEFGLQIDAQAAAQGISATIPLPMDWPEQTVEILDQQATPGAQRIKQGQPTKWTRQLEFAVNRMQPGQQETVVLRCRIRKRMLVAPEDTSGYRIADKVPADVKTFLKPSPFIESKDRRIREIADELWNPELSGWAQVEANYRWVRTNVRYEFDKTIRSCLEALDKKQGDCEELSSLFIAICRAQGIPARAVWIPDHTYPEFYLVDAAGEGQWFPCQAAGTEEFGGMTELKPILQKGDRFKMPGQREEIRYIQPTLVARDAQGPLAIKWIRREVSTETPGN